MAIDANSIIQNATNAYNSAITGYKTQLAAQQQQQANTLATFNSQKAAALGGLEQQSNVAGQTISNQYAQDFAKMQSGLVGRGLINTTVQDSLGTGLTQSSAFAQSNRLANFAKQAADTGSQYDLAALGYQGQSQNADLNFAGQGLNYAGQGAMQIGNLAQGFAGLENQQQMQQAGFDQQVKMLRLQQLYGLAGRGGVSMGGAGGPQQQGNFNPNNPYGGSNKIDQMATVPYGQAAGAYGGTSDNGVGSAAGADYGPYSGDWGGSSGSVAGGGGYVGGDFEESA